MELTVREFSIPYSCVEFWRNFLLLNFTSIKKINKNTNRKTREESGSEMNWSKGVFVLFCFVLTGWGGGGRRQAVPGHTKRKDELSSDKNKTCPSEWI